MRARMNHTLLGLLLAAAVVALPHSALADSREAAAPAPPPTAGDMIFDGLIIRPVSLAATAVGTGVFIVTLPFSLLGGNVDDAGRALVSEPAKYTFTRCLGCFSKQPYGK